MSVTPISIEHVRRIAARRHAAVVYHREHLLALTERAPQRKPEPRVDKAV